MLFTRPASGFLRLQETSVSRGVRRNALVKASERHVKECPGLFGVNENLCYAALVVDGFRSAVPCSITRAVESVETTSEG